MAKRVFSQTFGVVAALIARAQDGKFLLVREAYRKGPDYNKWNHPAGWIEVGEDPIEGIKREAKEETGYDFIPTQLLGVYSLVRSDIRDDVGTPHAIKLVYTGNISDKPVGALHDDISMIHWFTRDEIWAMSNAELRDMDIKQMIEDYWVGKGVPLSRIIHTEQR